MISQITALQHKLQANLSLNLSSKMPKEEPNHLY